MRNQLKRKLNSCTGESIAESLVSILVVAVASIMFAGMVTASRNIIDTSSNWMKSYYQAVSAINAQDGSTDPEVKGGTVSVDISGVITYNNITTYSYKVAGVEIVSYIPPTPSSSPAPAGG